MTTTREHGVTVYAFTQAQVTGHDVPAQVMQVLRDFGYVAACTAADGTPYLLCAEGVGWKADSPVNWLDGIDASPMDLADFIRVFGSRLESNFYLWHRTLTAPKAATS